ncbi:DUF4435 domain-containing protein [Paracraurococcus ruber]|uniref:DUF4435 domain-containing protein n=1 Tax=Paracraurococcus ruber TaxID=77675 RepID=A0ABS1CWG7_9PROT|nr:DUF4435 domain-containing protein [Paracraurococcus ruber]MBK1658749.1 hypothetical protein [Paracraurococcus ruber]TDG29096.1 DUF4435 domain-containing protein [Paracraurococcus ruber]
MSGHDDMSVEELISTLGRSSLPTIITEGRDDFTIFRKLESRFVDLDISVMPVGGKQKLLEIYRARSRFSQLKVCFVADQDFWVIFGVPNEYQTASNFFITDGYSIENDLIMDGELENLLDPEERVCYTNDLRHLCRWFSFCISQIARGQQTIVSAHPDRVVPRGGNDINAVFRAAINYVEPDQALFNDVFGEYQKKLRGKTLLQTLVRHLSYSGRTVRHRGDALLEMAAARSGPRFKAIQDRIWVYMNS